MIESVHNPEIIGGDGPMPNTPPSLDSTKGGLDMWYAREQGIVEYWVMRDTQMCMPISTPFNDYQSAMLWMNRLLNEEAGEQLFEHADVSDYT